MCPDETLLSELLDGETKRPWDERLRTHILKCEACAAKYGRLEALKARMANAASPREVASLAAAEIRIRMFVDQAAGSAASPAFGRTKRRTLQFLPSFLTDKISVPSSVLAASVVAVLILAGFAFGLLGSQNRMAASSPSLSYAVNASPEMLSNFIQQSGSQPLLIQVPNDVAVNWYGDPVVVPVAQNVANVTR